MTISSTINKIVIFVNLNNAYLSINNLNPDKLRKFIKIRNKLIKINMF